MAQMDIRQNLKSTYFKLLIPVTAVLVIIYLIKLFGLLEATQIEFIRIISILFFILAAVFSLALPIFYRTLFVSKLKNRKTISLNEFLGFEKRIILISMLTPYFIIIPLVFNFPGFYFGGIILFALYAAYYFYPSKKRIEFEKKLFRIKEEINKTK
jgi:hypothetical protein